MSGAFDTRARRFYRDFREVANSPFCLCVPVPTPLTSSQTRAKPWPTQSPQMARSGPKVEALLPRPSLRFPLPVEPRLDRDRLAYAITADCFTASVKVTKRI